MQPVCSYCRSVCYRYDINQSNLRSRINQSVSESNRYDVEQSRYSEVKQLVSGNNTIIDFTIRKPLKSSEPEYETVSITSDPKLNLLNVQIMKVGCDVMHKMLAYIAAFAP